MSKQILVLALATWMLAACGSNPARVVATRNTPAPVEDRHTDSVEQDSSRGGYLSGDGPGADIPTNLDETPDAVPRSEPLHKYANRRYVALGKTYTPLTVPGQYKQRGSASWYGKKFHGQHTSIGETYNMYAMTAAHPTLPIPSYARVTNLANQKSVVVRVNDRGPFLHNRIMDLSYVAAYKLGIIGNGSGEVEVESLASNAVMTSTNQTKQKPVFATVASSPAAESVTNTPLPPAQQSDIGTAPVKSTAIGGNVYLQLGAFRSQQAASSFLAKMEVELSDFSQSLSLINTRGLARVHIGPYKTPAEARNFAELIKAKIGFKPVLNLHE